MDGTDPDAGLALDAKARHGGGVVFRNGPHRAGSGAAAAGTAAFRVGFGLGL